MYKIADLNISPGHNLLKDPEKVLPTLQVFFNSLKIRIAKLKRQTENTITAVSTATIHSNPCAESPNINRIKPKAKKLNMTPETLSRSIKKLKEEGAVTVVGKVVKLKS